MYKFSSIYIPIAKVSVHAIQCSIKLELDTVEQAIFSWG